jgi:hypothetical protein
MGVAMEYRHWVWLLLLLVTGEGAGAVQRVTLRDTLRSQVTRCDSLVYTRI